MDTLSGFNYADIAAALLILVWTIFGLKKGMSGQIAFFLAGITVLLSLYFGYVPMRDWLVQKYSMTADLARITAIMGLVVCPLLAILLIHAIASQVVKLTFTAWVDRLSGAIAAFFTACAFVLLVFVLLNVLPENMRPDSTGESSWIGRKVLNAKSVAMRRMGTGMNTTRNALEKARDEHTSRREKWEQ